LTCTVGLLSEIVERDSSVYTILDFTTLESNMSAQSYQQSRAEVTNFLLIRDPLRYKMPLASMHHTRHLHTI
jgi:hypothetical protein